jgi:hypothetical protein
LLGSALTSPRRSNRSGSSQAITSASRIRRRESTRGRGRRSGIVRSLEGDLSREALNSPGSRSSSADAGWPGVSPSADSSRGGRPWPGRSISPGVRSPVQPGVGDLGTGARLSRQGRRGEAAPLSGAVGTLLEEGHLVWPHFHAWSSGHLHALSGQVAEGISFLQGRGLRCDGDGRLAIAGPGASR